MEDDLSDRILGQARVAAKRKSDGQRSRKAPKASPHQSKRPEEEFTALVLQDKLYYYFATPSNEHRPSRLIVSPSREAKDAEKVFVRAFIDAWHRVPQPDREKLKDYWQRPNWNLLSGEIVVPSCHPRPLIQLVDDWWDHRMEPNYIDFRDVLKFSVSAILQNESGLCTGIVKTLVKIHWHSSVASSELLSKMIDDPEEAWLERHRDCSDAAHKKMWDALVKKYNKAYDAEMARILHRWEKGLPAGVK